MGFEGNSIKLLIKCRNEFGIKFTRTLTVGRQGLHIQEDELGNIFLKAKVNMSNTKDLFQDNGFAEKLLMTFGAEKVDSIDVSDYERATIIHDMNKPIDASLKNKYSVVIDGGSLEHVFNFPQAIKNCMEMVEPGGYFIGITPANNYFGHGFYQFSPELYFRIMDSKNGFKMKKLYFFTEGKNSRLYEVLDPLIAGDRVSMINSLPSYLFVVAQKTEEKEIFADVPLQSDYVNNSWKGQVPESSSTKRKLSISGFIKAMLPVRIKTLLALNLRPTGISNQDHFKEIKF